MVDRDDIDAMAAEYALGTLSASEREAIDRRRAGEQALDAAIKDWEARLAPLMEAFAPEQPPTSLFAAIEARLLGLKLIAVRDPARVSDPSDDANIVQLQSRIRFWRRISGISSALAASFALAFVGGYTLLPRQPETFVGVFQQGDTQPAFLLTIDLASRELSIRLVAAERVPDKTYQLWIASDQLGPEPRSLGLIADAAETTRKSLTDFQPALLQRATFGVSLEPPGGSPTGRPTSPALHAKLFPAKT